MGERFVKRYFLHYVTVSGAALEVVGVLGSSEGRSRAPKAREGAVPHIDRSFSRKKERHILRCSGEEQSNKTRRDEGDCPRLNQKRVNC